MRPIILAMFTMGLSSITLAHEFEDMLISKIVPGDRYISVFLENTSKGTRILCAVYDEHGRLVGAEDWKTDNLVTDVIIRNEDGSEPPFSARCVLN